MFKFLKLGPSFAFLLLVESVAHESRSHKVTKEEEEEEKEKEKETKKEKRRSSQRVT